MKRLFTFILLIVCLLAVSVECMAQYPYSHVEADGGVFSSAIVRYYPTSAANYVVVYYEKLNVGHVALVDVVTGLINDVSLDSRVKINDMRIVEDTLYMGGGENVSGGQYESVSCIARMAMSDFLSGTATVKYFEPCLWLRGDIKRLAAYKCYVGGMGLIPSIKLFTVGDIYYDCNGSDVFPNSNCYCGYYTDPESTETCIVNAVMEVADPHINPTIYSWPNRPRAITPVSTTDKSEEIIHDVAVTANYVAFVGVMKGTTEDYIVLHSCKKNKEFMYDTMPSITYNQARFNTYYKYPLGGYFTGHYRACGLYGEYMAIATENESPLSTGITLRIFDMSTRQIVKSLRVADGQTVDFIDMVFDDNTNRIVLLFYKDSKMYLCPVDPFCSLSLQTVQCMVKNRYNMLYTSLDDIQAGYIVAVSGMHGLVSNILAWTSIEDCYEVLPIYVKVVSSPGGVECSFEYDIHGFAPGQWQTFPNPNTGKVKIDCIRY